MAHTITKTFSFDSAHWLPNVPEDHKCKNLHGHTYSVTISVSGELGQDSGWVVDFGDIKSAFKPIMKSLDHKCLNDIEGLENPTAEVMAQWIFEKLAVTLPGLSAVTVRETPTTSAIYTL